jgi:outer membrane murein-binding lipoprotein Lpp
VAVLAKYAPDIIQDLSAWIARLRMSWSKLTWSVCSSIKQLESDIQANKQQIRAANEPQGQLQYN